MQTRRKLISLPARILCVADHFEHAAERGQFWYDISCGCDALENVLREPENRISKVERDALITSITKARISLYGRSDFDPVTPDGRRVVLGFDAIACLTTYLSEDATARSRRSGDVLSDFKRHARILQNISHNYSLEGEMHSRRKPE